MQERVEHVGSHQLIAADVQPRTEGSVVACQKCGAFAHKHPSGRRRKLTEQCPGNPTTIWMRKQLDRLQSICYPGDKALALGQLRPPSGSELEWLNLHQRPEQKASAKQATLQAQVSRASVLQPGNVLKEFGILNEGRLAQWRNAARVSRADCPSSDEGSQFDSDSEASM